LELNLSKKKTAQVCLHVPGGLYHRFRVRCLREGTTVREVISTLIEGFVQGEIEIEEKEENGGKEEKK
jgi:hypothetical protein